MIQLAPGEGELLFLTLSSSDCPSSQGSHTWQSKRLSLVIWDDSGLRPKHGHRAGRPGARVLGLSPPPLPPTAGAQCIWSLPSLRGAEPPIPEER